MCVRNRKFGLVFSLWNFCKLSFKCHLQCNTITTVQGSFFPFHNLKLIKMGKIDVETQVDIVNLHKAGLSARDIALTLVNRGKDLN